MIRRTLTVAVAAALAGTPAALGDGETRVQGYASTFSALDPNVLGVTVNVFGPRNQIRISNYSGKTVVIEGAHGEPFLRFRGRAVEENLGSPTRYVSAGQPIPAFAFTRSGPRWRKVARSASYTWHDHRINWVAKEPPPAVREAPDDPHFLFRWRIPATADGRPFAITGFLGWAPRLSSQGTGTSEWLIAGAVGASLLVVGALGLGARRARRRAPEPPG